MGPIVRNTFNIRNECLLLKDETRVSISTTSVQPYNGGQDKCNR